MMAKDQGDVSTIEDLAGRSPQELRETLQTLPVHQIELEMQNEELGRTQSAMDTAEARYFDFYDLAPTGYVTVSDKSLILQANLTAATLLGLPRADLIGKALPGFMPAADANRYYLLCRQALATDRVQSCELCLQQSNRDVVWVNLQAIAAIGDEGTAVIRLVLSDITQRLQLEHAAKESIDEKFRLVADNTSDGIVIFGADSRIQYVSPAYVKQLGYSEAEERNRSPDQIYALIHPEDRDALFAQIEQAIESKASDLLYSYRIRHRLGHIIWREDHARFQYDGAGSYAGACVVARDITARKQAEEALQHTQALLADAEKIGRVGGWEIDVQTLQTTWTEAVYDIYEMYGTERLTVNESIKYYSSASRPIIEQAVQRAIEQGEPFDLELDIISAKGNRRSVHAVGKPDRARGKVSGFFQDITESKRAEAAMQEMNRNLIESRQQLRNLVALNETNLEKEKRHIAREVHDELGQILTALRMDLSLAIIRHADHVPDLLGALNGMKMQVDRAVEGVRNVANSLRPAALDMGLVTALEWLCLEFTKHGAVECALQGFDRDFDIDDARAMVIFRIVQEALNNVQKYAQASQVDITLERRAAELSLEVRDNGLGFDPVAVAQRGTLGLLGMRERGIALGGWVEVVSTPGQGTVIELVIPLEAEVAKAPA